MSIIINLLQSIVPFLIKFISNHSDEWLEDLYKKIGNSLTNKSSIKIIAQTEDGKEIPIHTLSIVKFTNTLKNLSKGTIDIDVYAEGYKKYPITINIEDNNMEIEKTIIMKKEE